MERAFERIKPGEDPPPPPPELLQWARETTYGLCGGIVYGAASAHYAERRRVVDAMESATKAPLVPERTLQLTVKTRK